MQKLSGNDFGFQIPSDNVDARVLGAGTAEQLTVPASAEYVRLRFSALGYYKYGANPTAAVPDEDIADGTASIMVSNQDLSAVLRVKPAAKISVIIAGGGVVTAEYFN